MKSSENVMHCLTVKVHLICYVPSCFFSRELERLRAGKNVRADSLIRALDPFVDDDSLLRVGGRLRRLDQDSVALTGLRPVIIPHKSPIANLIAHFFHDAAHVGVEWTVSLIRRKSGSRNSAAPSRASARAASLASV